eukprot:12930628-Prorocentrum_lima.AAC.1
MQCVLGSADGRGIAPASFRWYPMHSLASCVKRSVQQCRPSCTVTTPYSRFSIPSGPEVKWQSVLDVHAHLPHSRCTHM